MQNTDMEKISENIKPQPQKVFDYYSGKLDPEEGKKIEEQLSEENAALLVSVKKLLDLDKQMTELSEIDTRKAYKKVLSRIHTNRRSHIFEIFSRVAAIIVLPLIGLTGILGYFQIKDSFADITYVEVNAAPGTISKYQLPDKSYVWLNSGSWLRYPTRFSEESRRVEIRGEAYFEVESDKEHPFYVNTPGGLSVRVTGTKFNVSAYDDERTIEVVLEEGRVNVENTDGNVNMALRPGECFYYDRQDKNTYVKSIETYEKTAWKDGKVVFRNASLDKIFKFLSRRYNVDINFVNKKNTEYNYRATFTEEDIFQILDYLSMTAPIKWEVATPAQNSDTTLSRKRINIYLE